MRINLQGRRTAMVRNASRATLGGVFTEMSLFSG
jgi:hypothetical protein